MSIGNQKTRDEGYVMVNTKVPPHVADFLNIIAKSRGTDIYGILQLFIQALIRAAKATTEITPEMKTLLHLIEMDADWNRAFNFASPSAMMDVAQVILVLQQYDGKGENRQPRKGFGLVMIDKPAIPGETPKMNYCVDDILERIAEVSMRGLYRELRQIGMKVDSGSLRETLTIMCDAYIKQLIDEEDAQEGPQMGNFHEFGKVIEWASRTKQRKHRTPDSLANAQMKIHFDDFDRQTADAEVDGLEGEHHADRSDMPMGNGVKPFDVEP